MNTDTDFLALYQELDLRGGCSVAELKSAYRRRVAELHPDRNRSASNDPARLQELTAAYAAALAFERCYGRLPGAQAVSTGWRSGGRATPSAPTAARSGSVLRRHPILLSLALLAAFAWALFATQESDDGDDAQRSGGHTSANGEAVNAVASIELGSDEAQVRAIEGAPSERLGQHWDYGPSWIEFKDNKVSAWYSSPLRPLHVASSRSPSPR